MGVSHGAPLHLQSLSSVLQTDTDSGLGHCQGVILSMESGVPKPALFEGYRLPLQQHLRYCQWSSPLASSASPFLVQADLESIRSNLLQRHGAYVNMTADERLLQAAQPLVNDFLQALPVQAAQDAEWSSTLPRINEAITVPTQVCLAHVSRATLPSSMLLCACHVGHLCLARLHLDQTLQ